ncbi:MAG TPA: four helix bundle protein [Gemmatimonadales bacterium]|nr:four helix bundle protein [Gemmatimonadales bacterium]
MTSLRLKDRTKAFALGVVRLVEALPRSRSADVIGNQLLRAGTSVAANYRAASRARSRREFIAKLGIVEEEGDEALFWIDIVVECGLADGGRVASLREEANQIVAMVVASIRTARGPRIAAPHSAFRTPH